MALWMRTLREKNGSRIQTVRPHNGIAFNVGELRYYVSGGNLESIRLNDGHIMWLNKDRDVLRLPGNLLADVLAHEESGMPLTEHILGDVLVANAIESAEEAA